MEISHHPNTSNSSSVLQLRRVKQFDRKIKQEGEKRDKTREGLSYGGRKRGGGGDEKALLFFPPFFFFSVWNSLRSCPPATEGEKHDE